MSLVSLDGHAIEDMQDLQAALGGDSVGKTVKASLRARRASWRKRPSWSVRDRGGRDMTEGFGEVAERLRRSTVHVEGGSGVIWDAAA